MRLIAASLRHYRCHHDLHVDFQAAPLTRISGPNESGKSTLVEALHRALFLSAKAGGEVLEQMRSRPASPDPEVELVFEARSSRWTLRKRFAGSRGHCSLQDGRGNTWQADEAESQLAELVGTKAVPRKRGAEKKLPERWGHLWVWQGSAGADPLALSAEAYDSERLISQLQARGGLSVQSPLDLRVMEEVHRRWAEIFTATGRSKAGSALSKAKAAQGDAKQRLDDLLARQGERETLAQRYADASVELERIARRSPQLEEELGAIRRRIAEGEQLQTLLSKECELRDSEQEDLRRKQTELEQWQQACRREEQLAAQLQPGQEAIKTLRDQQGRQRAALERGRAEDVDARQGRDQLDRQLRSLAARRLRHGLQMGLRDSLAQKGRVQTIRDRLVSRRQDLAQLPAISAGDVKRLRQLQGDAEAARIRCESLGASIELLASPGTVHLGGTPLLPGQPRQISQPQELLLADHTRLRISPGGGDDLGQAQAQAESSQQRFQQQLERLGVDDPERAATVERQRSDLRAELQSLEEQAGGDRLAVLERKIEAVNRELDALPPSPGGPEQLDRQHPDHRPQGSEPGSQVALLNLEAEESRLQQEHKAALERETRAGAALTDAQQAFDHSDKSLRAQEEQLSTAERDLAITRDRLGNFRASHGEQPALQQQVGSLSQSLQARTEAVDARQKELQELDLQGLQQRNKSLQDEQRKLGTDRDTALRDQAEAAAGLHVDGRVDLNLERDQREAELEQCKDEEQRLQDEADMLILLRDLLEQERNALAEQYTAPLTKAMQAYLQCIFPDSDQPVLEYDANTGFHGLKWQRDGGTAWQFAELSGGTREQVAAALRLAMAEVLASAYEGCLPVVFDDAFVNADFARRQTVELMLQRACEQGLQIIQLSCNTINSTDKSTASSNLIELG